MKINNGWFVIAIVVVCDGKEVDGVVDVKIVMKSLLNLQKGTETSKIFKEGNLCDSQFF